MKEYYCLLLNNCYDKGIHWVCPKHFSMLSNVLEKDLSDLELLEQAFMNLDDTIIPTEEGYHVLGNFPVFGEIQDDGKMHDVVTGKVIKYAKNPKEAIGLSYSAKYRAYDPMVEEMLTLLDETSTRRYVENLSNLEAYSTNVFYGNDKPKRYLALRLRNAHLTPTSVIAKELNGQIIDVVTKEPIYPTANHSMITSKISTNVESISEVSEELAIKYQISLIEAGIENYLNYVTLAKGNSVKGYNSYVTFAKDEPKVRLKNK